MNNAIKTTLMAFLFSSMAHTSSQAAATNADKTITVFKTPWCGCCEVWVKAMREAGYTVNSTDMEDLSLVKKQAGISENLEACHTSVIGGDRKYVLEGHVPIEAVEKLMTERPDIRGISTPGMPMGSLGMNYDPDAEYRVLAFTGNKDAKPTVFYKAGK